MKMSNKKILIHNLQTGLVSVSTKKILREFRSEVTTACIRMPPTTTAIVIVTEPLTWREKNCTWQVINYLKLLNKKNNY